MSLASERTRRFAKIGIPFAVSTLLLAYLFTRIDAKAVGESITTTVVLRWALPLIVFNITTLAIESHCLHRVAIVAGTRLDHWTAARIKAACYLLGILNFSIGAAGLSILLRRRARIGLSDAAGMVLLILLFDVGAVLAVAAASAIFVQSDALGVRIGLIAAMIAAILAGFIFLKIPVSLGPLERLRGLNVFRAPRSAPLAHLIELALLRLAFVVVFVALVGSLLWAFEIEVPAMQLAFNVAIMLAVSALPIAAGGLGTGQFVFVELFKGTAPDAQLLAASLVFSFGLIATRALLGWGFALEFTRDSIDENGDPR